MGRRVEGEAGRGGGGWTGRRRPDGEEAGRQGGGAGGGRWTRRRGGDRAVLSPSPCMARSPKPHDLGQREAAPPLGTSPEQQIPPTAWLWALALGSLQPSPQHLSMNRCPFPVHPRLPTLMAPTRDQQGYWGSAQPPQCQPLLPPCSAHLAQHTRQPCHQSRAHLVSDVLVHALHGTRGRVLQGLHGQGPRLLQVPVEEKRQARPEVLQRGKESRKGERPRSRACAREQARDHAEAEPRGSRQVSTGGPSGRTPQPRAGQAEASRARAPPLPAPGPGTLYLGNKTGRHPSRQYEIFSCPPSR